jgi:predicted Holliday junction resolvase-like endonuclease
VSDFAIVLLLIAILFLVTAEKNLRKRVIKLEKTIDPPNVNALRSRLNNLEHASKKNAWRIDELEAKRWPVAKPVNETEGGK